MRTAQQEIERVLGDLPCFRFAFPDMKTLRRLDASETTRRRREVRRAQESIKALTEIDKEALTDIDPSLIAKLKELLGQVGDEDQ